MARRRVADALPLHLTLDRESGEAMHRQLYTALRNAVLDGAFTSGARLPSTRALAEDLGVSRTTVLQAFDRLVSEGYATSGSTGGTRVAHLLPRLAHRAAPSAAQATERSNEPPRLSRVARAYVDEFRTLRPGLRPGPFALGIPAIDEFPTDVWARLVARRWRTSAAHMLGYTDVRGYPPLREAIAQYVRTARGVRCTADQILVVNGAQHGIDLMARLLLDPGDAVWVEEPGYRPVRAALRATGAHLIRVPVDAQGIDVQEGERLAPHARLVFVTPSFQAPLGVALSLERRLALLDWAVRADAWVLEDDYNGEFRYDTEPIPSLQGLDRDGRVIYVGTFSKTLAPGLRIGFLVVPEALVGSTFLGRLGSDFHSPVPTQIVLTDFIAEGHFARHVRRMRALYQQRQATLVALAPRLTGGMLDVQPTAAGMRVLGLLPPGVDAGAVADAAAARSVRVKPWPRSAHGLMPPDRDGILLGYAAYDRETTEIALGTLGDVIRQIARSGASATRRASA